jgi:hypothetical protein
MTTAARLATTQPTGWAGLKQRSRALGGRRTVRDRPPRGRFPCCELRPLMMPRGLLGSNCAGADHREQLAAIYNRNQRAEHLAVLGRKEQDSGIL